MAPPKQKLLSFKTPIHDSHEQNTVFYFSSIRYQTSMLLAQQRKSIASGPWEILTELRTETRRRKTSADSRFLMNKIIRSILHVT